MTGRHGWFISQCVLAELQRIKTIPGTLGPATHTFVGKLPSFKLRWVAPRFRGVPSFIPVTVDLTVDLSVDLSVDLLHDGHIHGR